jgi:hypothetical protein
VSRIRWVAAATSVFLFASITSVALAAKVTGGTSQVTASPAAKALLAANHITVTPVSPATSSGTSFTFPIKGGRFNTKTLRGFIRNGGGITVSHGSASVTLRDPTIVSTRRGVSVDAVVVRRVPRCHVAPRHRLRCVFPAPAELVVTVAKVAHVSVSGGKATGTLKITAITAEAINALAGKHVVSAGAVLGTGTVTPTLK